MRQGAVALVLVSGCGLSVRCFFHAFFRACLACSAQLAKEGSDSELGGLRQISNHAFSKWLRARSRWDSNAHRPCERGCDACIELVPNVIGQTATSIASSDQPINRLAVHRPRLRLCTLPASPPIRLFSTRFAAAVLPSHRHSGRPRPRRSRSRLQPQGLCSGC